MTKQTLPAQPGGTLGHILAQKMPQIRAVLPKHLTPERMARIVMVEVRKNPQLADCEPMSIFGAVLQLSQLGLEPGGALGHAYLLPYRDSKKGIKEAQLIIGYRGMLDLARRSGQVLSIDAQVVYEEDEFSYSYGTDSHLRHIPALSNRGDAIAVYACAKLRDSAFQFMVLSIDKVNEIRDQALKKTKGYGPWRDYEEEMRRKTSVRALFKYLPVSTELQRAVGLDEMADTDTGQQNAINLEAEFEVLSEDDMTGTEKAKKAVSRAAGKSKAKERRKGPGEEAPPPASGEPGPTPDDWDALEGTGLIDAINKMIANDEEAKTAFSSVRATADWNDIRDFARGYAAKIHN